MKIKLQGKTYIVVSDTQYSCKKCDFVSKQAVMCKAPIYIYRRCVKFNEIFRCSNTHSDVFNL